MIWGGGGGRKHNTTSHHITHSTLKSKHVIMKCSQEQRTKQWRRRRGGSFVWYRLVGFIIRVHTAIHNAAQKRQFYGSKWTPTEIQLSSIGQSQPFFTRISGRHYYDQNPLKCIRTWGRSFGWRMVSLLLFVISWIYTYHVQFSGWEVKHWESV